MSLSALPILYTNYFKSNWNELFGLALLIYIGTDDLTMIQKILYPMALLLLYFIAVGIQTYLRYRFFKFYIADGHLIVEKGIFKKQTVSIPTYKIYSLRTKSGFFYRLFDMKGISVDTLADKEREVELILDDSDWLQLLEMFKDIKAPDCSEIISDDVQHNDTDKETDRTLSYPNLSLIKGALCQNHLKGTIIMAVILFNIVLQLDESVISSAADYAVEQSENITLTPLSVSISLVALYFISLLFWIGRIILRYYNMRLDISTDKLFFESGLITRRSVRFAHDKLSTIKIKTNILEHMMHCSTVSILQAFNVTDEKEKNDVLIYGCSISENFLKWWFGNSYDKSGHIMQLRSGKGVFWYSIRYKLAAIITACIVLFHFEQYVYIILLGILLAVYIVEAVLAMNNSYFIIKDDYIEVHTGGFATITYYLKYSDVENISVRYTPFTNLTHRVNISFSTNGSYFSIRSLQEKDALAAYDVILAKQYISDEQHSSDICEHQGN